MGNSWPVGFRTTILFAYEMVVGTTVPITVLSTRVPELRVVTSIGLLKVTDTLSLIGTLVAEAAGAVETTVGAVKFELVPVVNVQTLLAAKAFAERS